MRGDGEEVGAGGIEASEDERGTDVPLVSGCGSVGGVRERSALRNLPCRNGGHHGRYEVSDGIHLFLTHWNSFCFSIVIAVTTRGSRPVLSLCSAIWDLISAVVNSVSAAVPAPQHMMLSAM